MALAQNPSANDGILTIFTYVIVVPLVGINGLEVPSGIHQNLHLSDHESDNMMVYPLATLYVCLVATVRFHVVPSHRSTVYALAKYLFIFKV